MAPNLLLEVAFPLNVDGTFQYRCPADLEDRALPGVRVLAPLGGRTLPGIIVAAGGEPRAPRLLTVAAIPSPEPLLDRALLDLVRWTATRYLAPLGLAVRAAVPAAVLRAGASLPAEVHRLHVTPAGSPVDGPPPTARQREILDLLAREGGMPAATLLSRTGADYRTLRLLAGRGHLLLEGRPTSPRGLPRRPSREPPPLTERQAAVADALVSLMTVGFGRAVLHGPAGSGKLATVLAALRRGLPDERQALVLVPETSLSPALAARLEGVFPGRVVVLRSDLAEGERRRRWLRCRSGEARVVIGARSAVFAPLPAPGFILVDDEHEASYKAEDTPRYHARDVAVERARLTGIPVVLASAAPSLETFVWRDSPTARWMELPPLEKRPAFRLVDLREERGEPGAALGGRLRFELRDNLRRRERSVLLVNRRGIASAVFCADCGFFPRCPACAAPLALPDEASTLGCRLCGHREPLFTACPRCAGVVVRPGSPGTRGVEMELRRLFPGTRVLRFDADTAPRRSEALRIAQAFSSGEAEILVGTMPAARGEHGEGVTLVGVVDADTSLHHPDFRAAERTYQLLAAAAGVVARGGGRARVIVQTRYPDHYALRAASRGEDDLFYRQEATLRTEASFPPAASLILITVENPSSREGHGSPAAAVRAAIEASLHRLGGAEHALSGVELLGPHTPPRGRREGLCRQQLLLKGPSGEFLRKVVGEALAGAAGRRGGVRIVVDVDPVDFS